MKKHLSDIVIDAYHKQHGAPLQEADLGFLVTSSRNLDIIQVFVKNDTAPAYIFRVASTDGAKQKLSCHCRILEELSKTASEAIRSSVPRIYCRTESGTDSVALEQAMPGVSLNTAIANRKKNSSVIALFAQRITDWLISLQQATALSQQPLGNFLQGSYVRATLDEYEQQAHPFTAAEKQQINAFLEEMVSVSKATVTLSLQHNDFSGYNILYDHRTQQLSFMDWEYACQEGLTIIDLFNFFVVLASVLRGMRESSGRPLRPRSFSANIHTILPDQRDFCAFFLDDAWLQELSRTCIDSFVKATGFDRRLLALCIFLFVLRNLKHCPECLTVFLKRKNELKLFEAE